MAAELMCAGKCVGWVDVKAETTKGNISDPSEGHIGLRATVNCAPVCEFSLFRACVLVLSVTRCIAKSSSEIVTLAALRKS